MRSELDTGASEGELIQEDGDKGAGALQKSIRESHRKLHPESRLRLQTIQNDITFLLTERIS